MRAYYSFVSAFYIPNFLWNGPNFMILLAWYETISVHSAFGTCLCNGRAQDWWVLEGNDGWMQQQKNSLRNSGGSRIFFRIFLNKHKLHHLIKRKIFILTTTTIKNTQIYKVYNCLLRSFLIKYLSIILAK